MGEARGQGHGFGRSLWLAAGSEFTVASQVRAVTVA